MPFSKAQPLCSYIQQQQLKFQVLCKIHPAKAKVLSYQTLVWHFQPQWLHSASEASLTN
jgi:hypothetical protein